MRIAMICSCGKRSLDAPPILDVEKILQDYAWRDLKEKSGPVEKIFLRRKDFEIEVPMNYFHFEDSDTVLKTKDSKSKPKSAAGHSVPETSVLSTQFRNNTNNSQTYKFRIERTRKATISVTFQRGFSIGGKAQFKLGLPKAFSQGGEIDMRLQISKTTGETFDETLTFEANSDINVEENCNYTANVAFTEREVSAEFMVQTLMRMPTGTAPVYIRRKRDHELYATVFINNLQEVFAEYKASAEPIDEASKDEKVKRYAIRFTTTGIVEGMRLSGQKIYLDSKKIEKDQSGVDFPAVSQSAAALVAGIGAAHHSGLFRTKFPSDSDEARDDSTECLSLSTYRSINEGQGETRILKAPQIPTIITTAPSSQETSPPSDAGTSTSLESQSTPEDKSDDVFERRISASSSVIITPKPSPAKPSLKETKSLSRGSKDDTKIQEHKSPAQSPKPKATKADSVTKSDSLKSDSYKPKPDPQKAKDSQRQKADPTKIQNITKQTSNPKELPKQSSNPKEVPKESSNPKELPKQSSNPLELHKQSSNPKELHKQSSNPKELQKQSSNPKELHKQSSNPKELHKQSSNPKELHKQSSNPKELHKQSSNPKELHKQSSNPRELPRQSYVSKDFPKQSSLPKELTKQGSNPKELTKQTSNPKDSLNIGDRRPKEDRPAVRRSFKHDTLERMERVSSLSEKPRILSKSGSLPRGSPQPVEAQSSEEDSTSSLSKLSKCTSV